MQSVAFYCNGERHYTECHYAKCRYAKCHLPSVEAPSRGQHYKDVPLVTFEWAKVYASVFVPGKPFQPSLMFQVRPGPHPRNVIQVLHSFQWLISRVGPRPYTQTLN